MVASAESVLVFKASTCNEGNLPYTTVLPDCRTISLMAVQFDCLETGDSLYVYSVDTGKLDEYADSIMANYPAAYENIISYLEDVIIVHFDTITGFATPIDLASGVACLDWDSVGGGGGGIQDNCPNDPNKTQPGICGCGIPDTDSDGDGTADCNDNCPNDINKIEPGICGCGVPDIDSDDDGILDCNDNFPDDYDNDGMPDDYEDGNGLNRLIYDADGDADGDGFSNIVEYNRGTDPQDPESYPSMAMPWLPLLLDDD